MVELSLKEIVDVLGGELVVSGENIDCYNNVSTDTRTINKNDIFFALKGENFNGNKYVKNAIDKGASLCIVDELCLDTKEVSNLVSILLVDNSEKALGVLASYYLKKMNVITVGVTGSVGKTSTKDMIAAALSVKYKVLKTLGNFNNHIGLPLTIFRLDSSYQVAILEMGMSNAGEIEYLASIARPDIVAITNIGLSHIENLGSQENILKAKLEATTYFDKRNTLIVNADDTLLSTVASENYNIVKVGSNDNFDIFAKNIELKPMSSVFDLYIEDKVLTTTLEQPGQHNVINYLLAVAVAEKLGVELSLVESGVKSIEKTSMRLDIVEVNGYTIINDCYNASPDSMKSAIDVQLNLGKSRNIAVLGSMFELGEKSKEAHYDIGEYIEDKNIDTVFATGVYTNQYKSALTKKCRLFDCKTSLIQALKDYIKPGDSILIKASRGAKFEEIYQSLL